MKETLRHQEAFEYYYTLGEKRSITTVSHKYNVSRPAVAKWSGAFNWQERIEQRDMENARRLEKKTNNTIVNEKAHYRKIIKASINTFVEKLKARKIEVDSIQDIERLIKLDLLLMGEATERDEIIQIVDDIK